MLVVSKYAGVGSTTICLQTMRVWILKWEWNFKSNGYAHTNVCKHTQPLGLLISLEIELGMYVPLCNTSTK